MAGGSMNYVLEKLRGKGREMEAEEWINYVVGKIKVWLIVLENFGEILIAKLDEVFPPKTREEQLKHWVQVAKPYIIAVVVLLIFRRCCCGRGGRRPVKMMVAPGKGHKIPRKSFEGNPKAYFRDLRGQ